MNKRVIVGMSIFLISGVVSAAEANCRNRAHDWQDLSHPDKGSTKTKRAYSYNPCWDFNDGQTDWMTWHLADPKDSRRWSLGPRLVLSRNGIQVFAKVIGWVQPKKGIVFMTTHVELLGADGQILCTTAFPTLHDPNGTNGPLPPHNQSNNFAMQAFDPSCGSDLWSQYKVARLRLEWSYK